MCKAINKFWELITETCALQLINPDVKITMVENTPDDPRQRKPDITKARELLGWEPKIKGAGKTETNLLYSLSKFKHCKFA